MVRFRAVAASAGALAVILIGPLAPDAAAATRSQVDWVPCPTQPGSRLECATIRVPLDHLRPHGKTIEVALSRLPATDPSRRRGIMLTNPGGPGGSGLGMPEYVAFLLRGYPQIVSTFDIVGFDPRFVGRSTPVTCGLTGDEIAAVHWPGAQGFPAEVERAQSIAAKCAANAGWAIPHATTESVARDMDLIRAALGERRVSYLGYSYGTTLGRAYISLFPQRVDRFVLDSNTHPHRVGRDNWRVFGPHFERMLWQFADFAAARDDRYGLATTASAVRQAFDSVIARAEAAPIPAGDFLFTVADIRTITFRLLYAENRFDYLGRFLGILHASQPLPPDLAFLANVRRWDSPPPAPADNAVAAFFLTVCADDAWPRDVERYRREHAVDSRSFPFLGPAMSSIWPCAFWPEVAPESSSVDGSPVPVLLINSVGDPATPYDGALAVRGMMPNSRLVSVPASHHAVLGEYPSPCVEEAAVGYLVDGRLRDRFCHET